MEQNDNLVVCKENKSLSKQIIRKIGKEIVDLENSKLSKEIFTSISQWKINQLTIRSHPDAKIPQYIQDIQFSELIRLELPYNKIESIEGLCRISMPALQVLKLYRNMIGRIKELGKLNNKKIRQLQLWENNINEASQMAEMLFQNISYLCFDPHDSLGHINGINWIAKLQCENITLLNIDNKKRIRQNNLYKTFKRKYQNIDITEANIDTYQ